MADFTLIATPAPRVPLFDLRRRKQQRRRESQDRAQHSQRELAAVAAQEAAKYETSDYLNEFLATSEWRDHDYRITIVWENLPTRRELESYGTLDETDGTIACRRLFKAVVVWDAVGHSLWKRLRAELEEQEEENNLTLEPIVEDWPGEMNPFTDSTTLSRSSSSRSTESSHSPRSSVERCYSFVSTSTSEEPRRTSLPWPTVPLGDRLASANSNRRSTEPPLSGLGDAHNSAKATSDSRFALPRLVSQNCANVVKKTFGRFSEGKTAKRGSI